MSSKSLVLQSLMVGAVALVGCDTGKIQETVDSGVRQTTQALEQTVETVKQETSLVGSMELTTDPPLAAKACYAELIDTGEGRPNVFRLASYKSEELERYPSILFEAHVDATSLSALVGQSVQGKFFAQTQEDGAVWSSPIGSPAAIAIGQVDEASLTCECTSAALVSSETGEESSVTGKFVAVLD